jgi:hypothetical protein
MSQIVSNLTDTAQPKRLGGRPRKAAGEKLKSVTSHVSIARYEELRAGAASLRQPISQFVRPLIEAGIKARKPPVKQLSAEQDTCLRQLAGMVNNLNQLTKKANQEGFVLVGKELAQRVTQLTELLDYLGGLS